MLSTTTSGPCSFTFIHTNTDYGKQLIACFTVSFSHSIVEENVLRSSTIFSLHGRVGDREGEREWEKEGRGEFADQKRNHKSQDRQFI